MGLKLLLIPLVCWFLLIPYVTFARTVTPQNVTFINDQNIEIQGKLFKPSGNGISPAVVMLHGCAGIYSYSDPQKRVASLYREWGDRLVKEGYVALPLKISAVITRTGSLKSTTDHTTHMQRTTIWQHNPLSTQTE